MLKQLARNWKLTRAAIWAMLTIALLPLTRISAQTSSCRTADANSARLLEFVRFLVTTTDPVQTRIRDSLGVAPMAASRVSLVTTAKTCSSAVAAYNAATNSVGRPRNVHLVSAGKTYAVFDPDDRGGEWSVTLFFDSKFKFVRSTLGP